MINITQLKTFNTKILAEVNHLLAQTSLTNASPKALTGLVFKDILSQKSIYLLVAKGGGNKDQKLVGMLTLYFIGMPSGLFAIMEDLIVDKPYRKWGVGRLLVEEGIKLASQKKARHISLRTNPKRVEANRLYRAMGFKLMPTNFYRINIFK